MRLAVFTLVILLAGVNFAAAYEFSWTPFVSEQLFTWSEYQGGGGRKILRERGPLTAAGVTLGQRPLWAHLQEKVYLFGGVVGYSGETQDGVPISLDVDYIGVDGSVRGGIPIETALGSFEPFAGIGYRWWSRNLHDTQTAAGDQVFGYTERWQNVYLQLGGRWNTELHPGSTLFLEAGAKNPFYVANTVNFTGAGDVSFRPVGRWTGFGEAGMTLGRWQLSATYEGFRFSQSPQVSVRIDPTTVRVYLQPDSSSDIWGLKLGLRF